MSSWIASKRNHSIIYRCTCGSESRRLSRLGGKSAAGLSGSALSVALVPFQPHQKAVAQHHTHGVPMETIPAPPLMLIPAQLPLAFFMILFHPEAPMRILHHHRHRGLWGKVTPEIFPLPALSPPRPLADEPAHVPCAIAINPPAAHSHKLGPQAAPTALTPMESVPQVQGLSPISAKIKFYVVDA